MRLQGKLIVLLQLILLPTVYGQTLVERLEEDDWMKRMTVDHRLEVYGTDLMGDAIDPHFGGLVFTQTDVSLPGNSHLPRRNHAPQGCRFCLRHFRYRIRRLGTGCTEDFRTYAYSVWLDRRSLYQQFCAEFSIPAALGSLALSARVLQRYNGDGSRLSLAAIAGESYQ